MTMDKSTMCDECIHRAVCGLEISDDCENFQSALEETAEIKWVQRETRIDDKRCPKCGEVISFCATIIRGIPYCSVCGKQLDDRFMNYCPNCGRRIK